MLRLSNIASIDYACDSPSWSRVEIIFHEDCTNSSYIETKAPITLEVAGETIKLGTIILNTKSPNPNQDKIKDHVIDMISALTSSGVDSPTPYKKRHLRTILPYDSQHLDYCHYVFEFVILQILQPIQEDTKIDRPNIADTCASLIEKLRALAAHRINSSFRKGERVMEFENWNQAQMQSTGVTLFSNKRNSEDVLPESGHYSRTNHPADFKVDDSGFPPP